MDPGFSGGTGGFIAAESMKGDTSHQTSLTPPPGSRIARRTFYRGLGAFFCMLIGVAGIRIAWMSDTIWDSIMGWSMIAIATIPPFLVLHAGLKWIIAKRRLMSGRCIHCGTPNGRSAALSCTNCGKDTSFES
jgi:hypothetical protein